MQNVRKRGEKRSLKRVLSLFLEFEFRRNIVV
jgi:hypothetical protein